MAILFVSQSFLFSFITLAIVLGWLLFAFKSRPNSGHSLFEVDNIKWIAIAYVLILLGSWMWFFFSQPNQVSRTWFIIFLLLIMVGFSRFLFGRRFGNMTEVNQLVLVFGFFLLIFFLNKFFILLGIILIFARVVNIQKVVPQNIRITKSIFFVMILLILLTGGSLMIFTFKDNAVYFDGLLTYDEDGLPFHTKVIGSHLRVVDLDLAESIMKKSNTFGSNTEITDVHLGLINGSTYWIGAVSFSGNKFLRSDLNFYQGFIAVDFVDPQAQPLIIHEQFNVGKQLAVNRKLSRVVYDFNSEYIIGDNIYFTQADDNKMRLMIPYTIQASPFFGSSKAGIVTQEIQKVGGILELDGSGEIVKDYQNFDELPDYGKVQYYSEIWLERAIGHWGESITSANEFGVLTHYKGPWKSDLLMGIDDDVRVIIDPDTGENVQMILLDSKGSENQILRGGIKANASGLFYYNFVKYGFIDTNKAKTHGDSALVDHFGVTTHGYEPLLPVLYPVIDNPVDLNDYAYVMPLQFQDTRFGGIIITDPGDATGLHSTVKIVESSSNVNITKITADAIELYLQDSVVVGNETADFDIDITTNYVSDGNTIFVMLGNLTIDTLTTYETVIFSQEYISDLSQWIKVVTSSPGDTLQIRVTSVEGELFATFVH